MLIFISSAPFWLNMVLSTIVGLITFIGLPIICFIAAICIYEEFLDGDIISDYKDLLSKYRQLAQKRYIKEFEEAFKYEEEMEKRL